MNDIHQQIDANLDRIRGELLDFLRIPSVSARGEHRVDVRRAADWLADRFRRIGMRTEVAGTPGHPIVLAEHREAGPDAPTVLIYGHYDVQPPEPLELWSSPPFEPTIRDGRIYARGAVDDKGQVFVHVASLEAHLQARGRLPVNVLVLVEGEEEIGSPNLIPFIETHRDRLAADAVVISDTSMFAPGVPTLGASLRGLALFELEVVGPSRDLHSGSYGGAIVNPATALARIVGSLHDADGRVRVDGFYDDVREDATFREAIAGLQFDEETFRGETGAPTLDGEAGWTTLERVWIRPTLDVNGIVGGYTGEGPKTVLPARAQAKLSCRLVPDQEPARIAAILESYLTAMAPKGVTVRLRYFGGGRPWRARLDGPVHEAAVRALTQAFGRSPVFAGEGGSIPIVAEFERVLGAPAVLLGFGLPGTNTHAPDEWFPLENLGKGAHAAAAFLEEMAAVRTAERA